MQSFKNWLGLDFQTVMVIQQYCSISSFPEKDISYFNRIIHGSNIF